MSREYRKRLFEILDGIDDLEEAAGQQEKAVQPRAAVLDAVAEDSKDAGETAAEKRDKAQEAPIERAKSAKGEELPEGWTGPNHNRRVHYTREFREKIARLHLDEKRSFESITNEFGVSKATITKWCYDMRIGKSEDVKRVQEENARLKDENVFLKHTIIMLIGKEMGEAKS